MATMEQRRDRLVTWQVEARGVRDPLVLAAMKAVRRELFVPKDLRDEAYDDTPLPIGSGQTISQPYIVAFMIEALALRGGEKVLEIGTGSGYAAAVLAEIAREVFTIERIGQLAERAAANLAEAELRQRACAPCGRHRGLERRGPLRCDPRLAGAPDVRSRRRQLEIGARMVVPVGTDARSSAYRITRVDDDRVRAPAYRRRAVRAADRQRRVGERRQRLANQASPWSCSPRPAVSLSLPGLIADHVRSTGYSDRTHVPFALEPARSIEAPDFKSGFGAIRLQDG